MILAVLMHTTFGVYYRPRSHLLALGDEHVTHLGPRLASC